MPPFQSLSITTSTQLTVGFNNLTNLPVLDSTVERDVFEEGYLPNGQHYSIQLLKPQDYKAVYKLYEAEYASGSNNLVNRTEDDTREAMDFDLEKQHGGLAVAVVLDGNHLASVGMIDLTDDEVPMAGQKKKFRGSPVTSHPANRQVCFKGATTHPEARGASFAKMIYPYRVALAVSFDRDIMVTKALDTNQDVNKAYKKNGWSIYKKEWLTEEEKVLNTYTQTRKQAVHWLKDNHPTIFQRLTVANANTPYKTIQALALEAA